jgi:hypothetical protein
MRWESLDARVLKDYKGETVQGGEEEESLREAWQRVVDAVDHENEMDPDALRGMVRYSFGG